MPKKAWDETVDAYRSRLKECAAYINSKYNVENLCRELPARLEMLRKRKGGRIKK